MVVVEVGIFLAGPIRYAIDKRVLLWLLGILNTIFTQHSRIKVYHGRGGWGRHTVKRRDYVDACMSIRQEASRLPAIL